MNLNNYDIQKDPNTPKVYYRHKGRVMSQHIPVINLVIVKDTLNGETRLKIEPNDYFSDKDLFTIDWKMRNHDYYGQFIYENFGYLHDYEFASEINKYLQMNFVEMTYCGMQLFSNNSKAAFAQTFEDYTCLIAGKAC
ncbi:MAG TPA: hypothetical protein VEC12_01295 [Bacteroidia bacterium]|nr:hypothetical protein [Bacteroidia bacterium]